MGYVAWLYDRRIETITVISQEDFPSPDSVWLDNVANGSALQPEQLRTVKGIAGIEVPDPVIADAQEMLFKILAWRFTPQESESVMSTEFGRILERMKITLMKTLE